MFRQLLIAAFLVLTSFQAQGQTQFGRYLGVLSHAQIEQDQLVKLDFIVDRQSSSEFRLMAVVSLYFGDFNNNEYVSYHFENVRFNILTGSLVFDQPDQDITFIVESFGNGQLTGRLRSTGAGDVGRVALSQTVVANPIRPLVQPLWGEYRGVCDGVSSALQIQTQRSNGDSMRMGNPFGTYDTTAQLGEVTSGCDDSPVMCTMGVYDAASYDFYTGKLDLTGRARNLNCHVTAIGVVCGNCSLIRTSDEAADLSPKSYPVLAGGFDLPPQPGGDNPAVSAPASSLSGHYKGFLFHENRGIYQAVSLNLATYQALGSSGNQALFISGISAAYFGDHQSREFVSHRFNEKEFPLLSPQIVLERIDGDADTVVQLTQIGGGSLRGIWYSILFGRVGTFEMQSNGLPSIPDNAEVMGPLTGNYAGPEGWKLDLSAIRESTPINTVNPFYPMNFKGAFRIQDITANMKIESGSFDYYTGKINMQLENGSQFSGYRLNNSQLNLKRPTPGAIRPMLPHSYKNFTKVTP